MNADKEFIKKQLELQKIHVSDESDYEYIARIYNNIIEAEKVLDEFPELDDEKIILTMDLKEVN